MIQVNEAVRRVCLGTLWKTEVLQKSPNSISRIVETTGVVSRDSILQGNPCNAKGGWVSELHVCGKTRLLGIG